MPISFWIIVLCGYMPRVGLLDHIVILFLVFWGISILFFTVAMPVYILTKSTQGFLFFTFLPTLIFYLFDDSILMGVRWYLIQFWSAFPWWLGILNVFSCTYWPSVPLLWKNVCLSPLPIFNWIVFAIELWVLYIF